MTYGTPGTHDDTEAEQTAVGDAMREWKRRNSSFLENVKAHPPLGAGASVEHGVEAVVITNAGQQGGSLRLDAASCSDSSIPSEGRGE